MRQPVPKMLLLMSLALSLLAFVSWIVVFSMGGRSVWTYTTGVLLGVAVVYQVFFVRRELRRRGAAGGGEVTAREP
ncbi:hypothetical protein M3148_16705 [Georgenia satyanarayanai]|uniref:hypothetical protein n=1 Tax=Georgenia satyanarayanai TaxID=860221 RepID=UPI00203F6D74|nr:hypothetical protein [Georgenia satyanarayanai]MCM3662615.1 hypothetical protein [Georgenia satyanarayanai]